MSDIRKKRICADEAFAAYMALGPSRSLTRLLDRYRAQTGVIPPASSTLKRWSTKDEWQSRAREHDLAVQAATSEKAIEREAEERVEVSLVVEDTYWADGESREPGWPTVRIRYLRSYLNAPLGERTTVEQPSGRCQGSQPAVRAISEETGPEEEVSIPIGYECPFMMQWTAPTRRHRDASKYG